MSKKISRRSFMKGAGTAALAVAAAGVLAGCSNDKADDIIEVVEKKEIRVVFALGSGQVIGKYQTMKVAKDATSIPASQIDPDIVPKGYSIASTGNLSIDHVEGQDTVTVIVTLDPLTKDIKVTFYDEDNKVYLSETATITVASDATTVNAVEEVTAPAGYTISVRNGDPYCVISNDEIIVPVNKKPEEVEVTVNYYYKLGMKFSVTAQDTYSKVKVVKGATTVEKTALPKQIYSKNNIRYNVTDKRTSFPIVNGAIEVEVSFAW